MGGQPGKRVDEAAVKIAERAFRNNKSVREVARHAGIGTHSAQKIKREMEERQSGGKVSE